MIRHRKKLSIMLILYMMIFLLQGNAQSSDQPSVGMERAAQVKIGDIAEIEGVRENQLVGFGLVTGLRGQGDSTRSELVKRMLANFMQSFGIQIEAEEVQSKNSAAVVVTASTPPFAREGQKIDVEVSSILDARNLEGGILLQTSLKAANGNVYAVAQGRIVSPEKNSSLKTVGRVISGALVERDISSEFYSQNSIAVLLDNPDFAMAVKVQDAIQEAFTNYSVRAVDAEKIEVAAVDAEEFDPVRMSAEIGELEVQPVFPARVVINPYSGVVVMGQNVRIAPVVISFKESELTIGWQLDQQEEKSTIAIENTAKVKDVINVLTEAGLTVDDIIDVLRTLERSGALLGTLEVM